MEASGDLHLHDKMDEPVGMVERGGGIVMVVLYCSREF
jgi:hypothetical protein